MFILIVIRKKSDSFALKMSILDAHILQLRLCDNDSRYSGIGKHHKKSWNTTGIVKASLFNTKKDRLTDISNTNNGIQL